MADEPTEKNTFCTCSLEYTSVACNRSPSSVDWGRCGLVAYAACTSIALYRPVRDGGAGRVECLLNGHKDRVNCVKWVPAHGHGEETELISGSTDKTAIVWRRAGDEFIVADILEGHSAEVNSIACLNTEGSRLIATASADSTLRIWRENAPGKFECTQTFNYGSGFALCLDFVLLPHTNVPMLACGREDCKVYLYVEKNLQFVQVHTLVGHEDWIRGLEFTVIDNFDILLATCSQDNFIRVWRISASQDQVTSAPNNNDIFEEFEELKLKSNLFSLTEKGCSSKKEFSVVLESVLSGHEDWVYSVHWQPCIRKDSGKIHQPLCLLSASMDKTMMLWVPDEASGLWLDAVRVGEVGGNTLGFYGGVFSPDGNSILAHGFQGAFHLWHAATDTKKEGQWKSGVTVGGHFSSVEDISWDPRGSEFLMSVSADQTTRLHAPWRRDNTEMTWHEIARPQVHGYDMKCLAMISRYRLASGADEKVIRVFDAPTSFLDNMAALCKVEDNSEIKQTLPMGASTPALGLSNKAVFHGDLESLKEDLEDMQRPMKASAFASEEPAPFQPALLTAPPNEENLLQNTLWPETRKLYGHGYEIFCLAANPSGTLLASACKASKAEHAGIIVWDTTTWNQVCTLPGPSLTVTQMCFSHSGQHLLAVSRDRTWVLYRINGTQKEDFVLEAQTKKQTSVHTRIIWACAWTPDDVYFTTVSRDKKMIMWVCVDGQWKPASDVTDVGEPVTAVDVAPEKTSGKYVIAAGVESGGLFLYFWSQSNSWQFCHKLQTQFSHTLAVKRLRWRRKTFQDEKYRTFQLASCSADHAVKIFNVRFDVCDTNKNN